MRGRSRAHSGSPSHCSRAISPSSTLTRGSSIARTGPSTLVNVLKGALGPYAQVTPPRLFEETRGERHPTEVADLWNTRLAFASEMEEGARLREAFIKSVTGSEPLKGRFMYRDFFEF